MNTTRTVAVVDEPAQLVVFAQRESAVSKTLHNRNRNKPSKPV
jgi:hypothetical protein